MRPSLKIRHRCALRSSEFTARVFSVSRKSSRSSYVSTEFPSASNMLSKVSTDSVPVLSCVMRPKVRLSAFST
jgi:hypothetical protein